MRTDEYEEAIVKDAEDGVQKWCAEDHRLATEIDCRNVTSVCFDVQDTSVVLSQSEDRHSSSSNTQHTRCDRPMGH